MTRFIPVEPKDVDRLAVMADEIWHEYWPERIGMAQTDYMVEQFQSVEAIERDMARSGYEYWFVAADDDRCADGEDSGRCVDGMRIVGYTGGHVEAETNRYFISKIYLFKDERGKGYATDIISFYTGLCRDRGLDAMYLTVNKGNSPAIGAYEHLGFTTIEATQTDIGSGFIMDDYIMQKRRIS